MVLLFLTSSLHDMLIYHEACNWKDSKNLSKLTYDGYIYQDHFLGCWWKKAFGAFICTFSLLSSLLSSLLFTIKCSQLFSFSDNRNRFYRPNPSQYATKYQKISNRNHNNMYAYITGINSYNGQNDIKKSHTVHELKVE